MARAPALRFYFRTIQLRLAQTVQVLAGPDEYLVSGCGRGGERVTIVETVGAEQLELWSCLDHCHISGFADEVEFAIG